VGREFLQVSQAYASPQATPEVKRALMDRARALEPLARQYHLLVPDFPAL
jgi:hypothetical protein